MREDIGLPHAPAGTSLSDVLRRVSDAFIALDRDWRYTYVNHRAAEVLGRRVEDLVGQHIWTVFPEGVGQPFHLAYERAIETQTAISMEGYYAPWDRWFENRIYPSPDGLSIFFHEITDRKRAEARARDSARLLEGQNQVLESIVQGTPLADTLSLLITVIEGQATGMLGSILLLDEDGRHVRHGAAPSLPESYIRAIDGEPIGPRAGSCGTAAYRRRTVITEDIATDPLWESYRPVALGHGLRASWSTPIFDADERVLGTFAMYFRVPCLPTDHHRQLIEISTDIAAVAIMKHRETEALHQREAQLASAQRIAHLGSYEWDMRTNTVDRSAELCHIFGVKPEDFKPTVEGYLEFVHPDDRHTTWTTIERSLREGTRFEFEERIIRPDGAIRQLRSQGEWMHDESGAPVRLMGICQDITERKLAEEQLRQREREIGERKRLAEWLTARNDELKAFAYTVSHDLKAPLRAIAGYANELDTRHREGLGQRAKWCLSQISTATHSLERLIEDLLQYSRLDTRTPAETTVALADLVHTILADYETVIAERHIEVDLAIEVARARTWKRGLAQILTNLVDNAVKFSRNATPPTIRIATESTPEGLRLSVQDNGIGFDMAHHDRVFALFTRLVRPRDFEGTGAGLAIAKKLTEKMGGRIHAESAPGAGATFYVDLPQDPAR
jgi:PAS domain S-box-containing protein